MDTLFGGRIIGVTKKGSKKGQMGQKPVRPGQEAEKGGRKKGSFGVIWRVKSPKCTKCAPFGGPFLGVQNRGHILTLVYIGILTIHAKTAFFGVKNVTFPHG